jgi:uncharacterized protein (TIGR04255 family)
MSDATPLPSYVSPPVVEVVCGILFTELASLQAVQLGSFWDKLKPDYPQSREVAPLAPVLEAFAEPPSLQLHFTDVPPLARTWFLTPRESGIVQVQRDRFLHNWKKVDAEDEYPRYSNVIKKYKKRLESFDQFLAETGLGPIEPLQYEMTYVNHIPQGHGWNHLEDAGNVFPDFVRRSNSNRFLPEPDQVNWRTSFPLPGEQGRLHAVIRHVQRPTDNKPMLLFELTARGIPKDRSRDAAWTWFDLAHEWIVRGFTDLTDEEIRKNVWRQIR